MNTISSVLTSVVSAPRAGVRSPALPPASGSPAQAVPQSSSPAATSGAASAPAAPVDLSKAVEQIQGYLRDSGKNLSVSFDDSADRYVTKVVSSDTGEVVRTIPSEEVLAVARAINEQLGGLVNQRA
jgi:flagellar protein FlaG